MTTTNMTGAGRYKLLQLLTQQEGFAAYTALDIETSTRPSVLINVYSGPEQIRSMVGLYYGLEPAQCGDFCRMYTEDGRFTTVFTLHEGEAFDSVFAPRSDMEPELRLACAETLMHTALEYTGMPHALLTAMLNRENLVVQKKNNCIRINAMIRPIQQQKGEPVLALAPLLEQILSRKWTVCDEQIDFLDTAANGGFETVSALYSAWRELLIVLEEDKKTFFLTRLVRYCKRAVRRWLAKRRAERIARRHDLDD